MIVRSCSRGLDDINNLVDEPAESQVDKQHQEYHKKLDEIYKMKAAITNAVLLELPDKTKKIAHKRMKIKLKK